MNLFEAIFLGIIQGITEFLPISSDGHLVLIPALFNLPEPDLNLVSIAHQGTLLAILVFFYRDLWQIFLAIIDGLRRRQPLATTESRLGWYILVATIPAGLIGILFKDFFEETYANPAIAAAFLFVTAAFLVIGERMLSGQKQLAQMSWLDALIIGVMQIPAILPGVSRSGGTIAAALARGFDRPTAARFSFLLGVPAIAGAGLLALIDLLQVGNLAEQLPFLLATFVTSAVVGYAAIYFLLSWLRQRSLYGFAVYCVALALLYFLVAALR
jgi:undecaprenyl-diphosphatase